MKKAATAPFDFTKKTIELHQKIEDKIFDSAAKAVGVPKSVREKVQQKIDVIRPERSAEKVLVATSDEIKQRVSSDIDHLTSGDIREGFRYSPKNHLHLRLSGSSTTLQEREALPWGFLRLAAN